MHNNFITAFLYFTLFIITGSSTYPVQESFPEIRANKEPISGEKNFPESIRIDDYVSVDDSMNHPSMMAQFYQLRDNQTAWLEDGNINQNALDLLETLELSWKEGLSAEFYNVSQIKDEINRIQNEVTPTAYDLAKLDMMLTQAYMDFAIDISTGRIDPHDLNVIWQALNHGTDLTGYLQQAIDRNQISQSLMDLRPRHEQYQLLSAAYQEMLSKREQTFWPLPGNIPTLKQNDTLPDVVKLKKYLSAAGYLYEKDSAYLEDPLYDSKVVRAVKAFQRNHGLNDDGIAGANTVAQMNFPYDYRLNQIRLNLDRLRWLPDDFGKRDVVVNIPNYTLEYYENFEVKEKMNVVVGKTTNYTPALKDTITYLVFNPTWNVPNSIASKEMLPRLKSDPSYLSRNNYKLYSDGYSMGPEVNPWSVNWNEITPENFKYFVVQLPGNSNSLGRIKFMLPNNHAIYLHDTPATHLFSREQRTFSHGCIRLEKPFQLAETLLKGQLTSNEIRRIRNSRKTESVILNQPIPVHLVYHTAWVDRFGELQFRQDIYRFDEMSLPEFDSRINKAESIENLPQF